MHLMTNNNIHGHIYLCFSQRILLLSSDVELNPGPSDDTQMILNAIQESNRKFSSELGAVKNEIQNVRLDITSVKSEICSVKQMIQSVETKQLQLDEKVKNLEDKFVEMQAQSESLQNAVAQMSYFEECENDRLDVIEQQVYNLEAENLKCSLRVFGLQEPENGVKNLKTMVNNNILQVADVEDNLTIDCIADARRIGNNTSRDRCCMVIVKFSDYNAKMKLFKYQDKLRENVIRISNNLTYGQRKQLKELSDKGYYGYFKNGKLYKRQKDNTNDDVQVFKRGVRKINRNSEEAEAMTVDSVNNIQ